MKKKYLTKSLTVALAIATAASTFSGVGLAAQPAYAAEAQSNSETQSNAKAQSNSVAQNNSDVQTQVDESSDKVNCTISGEVLYGKGTFKIVSATSTEKDEDGNDVYKAYVGDTITVEITPEQGWKLDTVQYMNASWGGWYYRTDQSRGKGQPVYLYRSI